MGVEIITSLSLDPVNKVVRGTSFNSNIRPRYVNKWSDNIPLSLIYKTDGEEAAIKAILRCYYLGEFHDTKGGKPNQFSLAVWYACTTKEYADLGGFPFDGTKGECDVYNTKRDDIMWKCYQDYINRPKGEYVLRDSEGCYIHTSANPRKCWRSEYRSSARRFDSREQALAFRCRNNYPSDFIPVGINSDIS